jgi:dTDP-4-dehydrorhamnose reductase
MRVGIVGANSQVGTELSFLLDSRGHETIPITRNLLGAATFGHHGFDYRVGDITDADDSSEILGDLDVVVVAAFARYVSRGELAPKQARGTNESLIRSAVEYTPADATVIYLSSISAFGSEIRDTDWWWYTREKRHLETHLQDIDAECGRRYAFRLGHVFGQCQDTSARLQSELRGHDRRRVAADPDRESNVVHTTTIVDAILTAHHERPESGTYTVVNEPNWTWRQILEYYATEGTTLVFLGGQSDDSSRARAALSLFSGLAVAGVRSLPFDRDRLLSASVYLPSRFSSWLWESANEQNVAGDIGELVDSRTLQMGMFTYDSAPGPKFPDLDNTERRLETDSDIEYLDIE